MMVSLKLQIKQISHLNTFSFISLMNILFKNYNFFLFSLYFLSLMFVITLISLLFLISLAISYKLLKKEVTN